MPTDDDAGLVDVDGGASGSDGGAKFDIGTGEDGTVGDGGDVPGDAVADAPEDATCATSEVVAEKVPVDIIMAIDQSGSMNDDIANVKANINNLSDYLAAAGLDYRLVMIARVGTSGTDVCVPPPLGGPSCASNPPRFRTSNQSVSSTNSLSRILSTYDSTTAGVGWKDFLRPEAFKAIIPITDDNSSLSAASFDSQLLAKAPAGMFGTASARKYGAFPIMGAPEYPKETPKCGSTMVNNGQQYIELVKLAGGKWFPLCSKDFGPLFIDIAKSIASAVACEVTVPPPPEGETFDPAKIDVLYTPSSGGSGVTISRDDSAPCASGANGWQLSADGSKILLCGTACTGLQGDPGGKVSVQFGCAAKEPPKCVGFFGECGSGSTCCDGLDCLPGPDGKNVCRVKPPA